MFVFQSLSLLSSYFFLTSLFLFFTIFFFYFFYNNNISTSTITNDNYNLFPLYFVYCVLFVSLQCKYGKIFWWKDNILSTARVANNWQSVGICQNKISRLQNLWFAAPTRKTSECRQCWRGHKHVYITLHTHCNLFHVPSRDCRLANGTLSTLFSLSSSDYYLK